MNSSSILEAEESLTNNTTTSKRQRIKSPITTTKTTNIVVPAGDFAAELATRVRSDNDAMITSHSSSSVSPRQPIPNAMTNSTEVTPTTTIPDCSIVRSQGRLLTTTAFSSHRKTAGRQLPRNNGEGIVPTLDIAQDQQKYNNISTKQKSAKSRDALVEDNKHDKTITVISLSRGDSTNIGATITPPTIDDVDEHDDKSEEETKSIGTSNSSGNNDSSSSSSSEESEEESNNADHHHHHRRQQQLSKLLRGIEGSAYANAFIRWEEMENANLSLLKEETTNDSIPNEASEVTMSDASTTPPSSSSSAVVLSEPRFHIADCSSMRPHRLTVRDFILEEYYHTLPASFSLLLHCTLYVVIYSLIAMIVEWVCKDIDMYYFAVMLSSLCMSRMTGNIYNWNDTSIYQKRLTFN